MSRINRVSKHSEAATGMRRAAPPQRVGTLVSKADARHCTWTPVDPLLLLEPMIAICMQVNQYGSKPLKFPYLSVLWGKQRGCA